jgi:hypothetical protein
MELVDDGERETKQHEEERTQGQVNIQHSSARCGNFSVELDSR